MRNVLNKICIVALSCLLIVCANIKSSHAFGPYPPMPFDIVLDVPANAGKVVSILQETKRYVDSIKRYKKALSIKAVVGKIKLFALEQVDKLGLDPNILNGDLSGIMGGGDDVSIDKTGAVLAKNSQLEIDKGETDEEKLRDAFYKLFLIYPAESEEITDDDNQKVKLTALQTIHKDNIINYRQDIAMNTYLYAKKKELFLDVIERTIDRLDACQKAMGAAEETGVAKPDDCTFFGMAMVEVPSQEEAPQPEGGSEGTEGEEGEGVPAGQSEEMQNAYVVSMVYDRVLRLIEELTAVEAEFRASQQIELVLPAEQGEEQSDASEYINNTIKFAYNEHYEFSNAKALRDLVSSAEDFISVAKKVKRSVKELRGSYEAENNSKVPDVGKMQALEHLLNQAIQVHNLKNQLPEYKMQYRQYLMAKKIHERAFNSLRDSETCIMEFIGRHEGDAGTWRGSSNPFKDIKAGVDNDCREDKSISKELLKEYQVKADKKILGTSEEEQCKDYYVEGSICPSGYSLDVSDTSSCKDETGKEITDANGKKLYPCVVKTITPEIPETTVNGGFDDASMAGEVLEVEEDENGKTDDEVFAKAGISDPNAEDSFNENEFMSNSDQSEQLENDTRKKNEMTWRIGAQKMLNLTESGKLKFKPWKDQKYLQQEYLRNKYRNLGIIVKSMDQAKISYKISKADSVEIMSFPEGLLNNLTEISKYVTLTETAKRAKEEYCNKNNFYCNGTGSLAYGATENKENGSVTLKGYKIVTKYYLDEEGNYILDENGEPTTYEEKVATTKGPFYSQILGTQKYTNEAKSTDDLVAMFTDLPNELKNRYLAEELAKGNTEESADDLAEKFYEHAKSEGRGIARDLLNSVFQTREKANNELKVFLNKYYGPNGSITKLEKLIEKQKTSLDRFVVNQDLAQQAKNKALDEEKRTKERLVDIDNQIVIKNDQISRLTKERDSANNKVVKVLKENEIKGAKNIIENLEDEKIYLSKAVVVCIKKCPTDEYFPLAVIKKDYDDAVKALEIAKAKTNETKASISENQSKLEEMVEDFSVEYIDNAQQAQKKIEYSNKEYEDFVEGSDADRMINDENKKCVDWFLGKWTGICTKYEAITYKKDNLEETVKQFYNEGKSLREHVEKYVEANINEGDITTALNKLNIADEFYLNGDLTDLGLTVGLQTGVVSKVVQVIKDLVVKHIVDQIVNLITSSDSTVQNEMERAVNLINDLAAKLGVLEGTTTPAEIDIYDATKYGYTVDENNKRTPNKITELHKGLFEDIKNGSELPEAVSVLDIYGIPELSEENNIIHEQGKHSLVDDEYFVALPARGVVDNDVDSGRDYTAPKGPMMNLPPLREVFYYSPLDYDDVPKEGNGKKRAKKERFSPSISHLLGYKYDTFATGEKWEYIPEIWRYILAVPSLREDGKFQQTFIERSMDGNILNKHLGNNDTSKYNNKYAHAIARAGVYPCKLGSKIIDVKATMDINEKKNGDVLKKYDIKYIYANAGENDTYPRCKEVQLSGTKIKHLLADEDKNITNMSLDSSARTSYNELSELGQFIDVNRQYRWFLQSVYKFLTDTTKKKKKKETPPNQINNVWRQMHDLSAYKRNLFGNFLDAVSAEKDAKTNLENSEYQLREVMKQLCEQVHELDVIIGDTSEDISKIETECSSCENCDDVCSEEAISARKAEVCVNFIMAKGLAKNVDDKAYGINEYGKTYSGVKEDSTQIYDELYSLLNNEKYKLLNDAQPFPVSDVNNTTKTEEMHTYKEAIKSLASEFKPGGEWDSRIADRMIAIEGMYNSLILDDNEIVYLTPDDKIDEASVTKAKTNKMQSFKSGEEGLKGMDNQSKVVPYCPSY